MFHFSRRNLLALTLGVTTVLAATPSYADQLADIRKAGEIKVAVFDANPPFGAIDRKTRQIVGYDVDFAKAIADKLGVRLKLVPTNPANRIPLLQSRVVDLIIADITITPERARVVDFTTPYFVSGQQVLAPVRGAANFQALAKGRIGAVKGTTGEQNIRKLAPQAQVVSYDDLPAALSALRSGQVQAITQDSSVLYGLLAATPDASKYRILPEVLSKEDIGIGVRKGEPQLLALVNQTLIEFERNGAAVKIYDRWFGRQAAAPQPRTFRIGPASVAAKGR